MKVIVLKSSTDREWGFDINFSNGTIETLVIVNDNEMWSKKKLPIDMCARSILTNSI